MKRFLFVLMLAALMLSSCASAAQNAAPLVDSKAGSGFEAGRAEGLAPEMPVSVASDAYSAQPGAANPAQERVVIQTADLSIVVKDPAARLREISAMATRMGGFVVSSNMSQTNFGEVRVPEGVITIRVPANVLESALTEIKANAVEVQTENRSGQDVTDQYVDLQSQLRAKQAQSDRLFAILEKTEKVEDTLMVSNQLTQVQSEIEVLKGQINYYEQAAALSAISVRLVAEQTIQPIQIAGWKPQGVARDAIQSLINFYQNFIDFMITLVILYVPVLATLIILLAVVWRALRWLWRKLFPKQSPPPAAPSAPAA